MKALAICTIAFTSLISVATADAGPATQPIDVTLAFTANDSAQDKYSLIVRQARKACSSRAVYPHTHLREERRCRTEFIASAVTLVDDEEVTALHLGRVGGDPLSAESTLAEVSGNPSSEG